MKPTERTGGDLRRAAACLAPALATALLAGCHQSYPSSVRENEDGRRPAAARTVKAVRLARAPLERVVFANGSLAAYDQATLSTKVAGRVESIAVDLGDRVRQGELVAQIEPVDYKWRVAQTEALLAQARARLGLPLEGTNDAIEIEKSTTVRQTKAVLDEAQANRDRIETLSKQGILSQAELDSANAAYQVALSRHEEAVEEVRIRQALVTQRRAELEIARQQLADTAIRAPFDGMVQQRRANKGEYLSASAPVVSVVQVDPLRLRLEVQEREAANIRAGQSVRLRVEGSTNLHSGEIKRLSPVIEEDTRVLRVEADVPNPGSLRPGAFVKAEIVVDPDHTGLAVPQNALVTFAGIEKVFIVQDDKALEKPVSTGRRLPEHGAVEIVAGLSVGDWVVLDPGNLQTGEPVSVSP